MPFLTFIFSTTIWSNVEQSGGLSYTQDDIISKFVQAITNYVSVLYIDFLRFILPCSKKLQKITEAL